MMRKNAAPSRKIKNGFLIIMLSKRAKAVQVVVLYVKYMRKIITWQIAKISVDEATNFAYDVSVSIIFDNANPNGSVVHILAPYAASLEQLRSENTSKQDHRFRFRRKKRNGNQASSLLFHGQQKTVFRYVPVRLGKKFRNIDMGFNR